MDSAPGTAALPAVGFPIRTSPDQSLVSGSPTLFAATHVLLRLLSPRHPSCALCSLVISLFNAPDTLLEKTRVQRGSVVNQIRSPDDTICLLSLLRLRICNCQRSVRIANPGGADRDRTDDIQLAKLALSQLSYGPVQGRGHDERRSRDSCPLGGADGTVSWWAWVDLNYRPH